MRRVRGRAEQMRGVVDCLPYETKLAMLVGIDRYEIIAGAYSDRSGRVCPMLAAHRCGGRTDFRSFARAWDRFTGARKRSRRASERELRTLRAQLEQSAWREEQMRDAIVAAPRRAAPAPGDVRPSSRRRWFSAWLLPFRHLDQYERAVEAAIRQAEDAIEGSEQPPEQRDAVGV